MRNYSLIKLALALPLDFHKNDEGRLIVETVFDEPFWIKRQPQVTPRLPTFHSRLI